MTSVRPSRRWLLLLLLYVTIDFMDSSIPGLFFFDADFFFVDGVVQAKSTASSNLAATQPMPLLATVNLDDEGPSISAQVSARPVMGRLPWKKLKHDDSASFGSASPADSSPTPPLS